MDLHDPRKKMSKSIKSPTGLIRLTDPPEAIRSKIAAATTDSGREVRSSPEKPGISNLITIYATASGVSPEETESTFSGKTYTQFKNALTEKLVEYLRPVRERYQQIKRERDCVEQILLAGSEKAETIARQTLEMVFDRLGFLGHGPHMRNI